jgi:hypothetical protein
MKFMLRLLTTTRKQHPSFPARIPFDFASDGRATWTRLQTDETCNQWLDLNAPTDWCGKGTKQTGREAKHLFVGFGGVRDVVRSI